MTQLAANHCRHPATWFCRSLDARDARSPTSPRRCTSRRTRCAATRNTSTPSWTCTTSRSSWTGWCVNGSMPQVSFGTISSFPNRLQRQTLRKMRNRAKVARNARFRIREVGNRAALGAQARRDCGFYPVSKASTASKAPGSQQGIDDQQSAWRHLAFATLRSIAQRGARRE